MFDSKLNDVSFEECECDMGLESLRFRTYLVPLLYVVSTTCCRGPSPYHATRMIAFSSWSYGVLHDTSGANNNCGTAEQC